MPNKYLYRQDDKEEGAGLGEQAKYEECTSDEFGGDKEGDGGAGDGEYGCSRYCCEFSEMTDMAHAQGDEDKTDNDSQDKVGEECEPLNRKEVQHGRGDNFLVV